MKILTRFMENYIVDYRDINDFSAEVCGIYEDHATTSDQINLILPDYLPSSKNVSIVSIKGFFINDFEILNKIVSIKFPTYLRFIGDYAFLCSNITSLRFPKLLNYIGEYSFKACQKLKEVYFDCEYLSELGNGLFYECNSLSYVELPKHLKRIKANCFYGCNSLIKIVIPEEVNHIGHHAFYESGITEVLFIGPKPRINDKVFSKGEKTAYVKEEYLRDYLSDKHFRDAFSNILTIDSVQLEIRVEGNKAEVIPSLDEFGKNRYKGCLRIPESIYKNNRKIKITKINQFAFFDSSLEKVKIPNYLSTDDLIFDSRIEIEKYKS